MAGMIFVDGVVDLDFTCACTGQFGDELEKGCLAIAVDAHDDD
jgi:hypothetical protein